MPAGRLQRSRSAARRPSSAGTSARGNVTYGTFGGLLNAAWEIDIWGRIRAPRGGARPTSWRQEDVRRGVMLTLVTDLATDYFQLLELDRELAIANDSSTTYKQTLDLFTNRFNAGKDSRSAGAARAGRYDGSQANVATLKRAITQQENAICVLVGALPGAIERGTLLTEQTMPPTPVGDDHRCFCSAAPTSCRPSRR